MSGPYVLYGRPGTGSAPVEAALFMSGLEHRIVDVPKETGSAQHRELLKLNPMGQVPVLILPDGTVMTESAAMLIHLGEHDTGLAPLPLDARRPAWLRAMTFLATNLYNDFLNYYYSERYCGEGGNAGAAKAAAAERIERGWKVFDGIYADAATGGTGILELYAATLVDWNKDIGAFARNFPALAQMAARTARHPDVAGIWQRHGFRALP